LCVGKQPLSFDVAAQRKELAALSQLHSRYRDRAVRVSDDKGDVALRQQRALSESLVAKSAHPDLTTRPGAQPIVDRFDVLGHHDSERDGHELGLGDGLAAPGALALGRREVDELPGSMSVLALK